MQYFKTISVIFCLVFVNSVFLFSIAAAGPLHRFTFTSVEMAVPVKITLYAENETRAKEAAEAAFLRFRDLNARLSDYNPASELRQFCDHARAGEFRTVSVDVWVTLRESVRIAELSDGAFDPTVGQVVRLWRRARLQKKLPPEREIERTLETVGYENLQFDEKTRSLAITRPGVRVDLGGIAKGYAIDEALATLRTHGITRAMVDAGGDVGLADPPPGEDGWMVGILPPDGDPAAIRFLTLANCGLANSGDLAQFVEVDGVRYSHIVDPKTGLGLTHRAAVSVIAPTAMTADALASAVSVLGTERGIALIETLPDTETLILTPTAAVQTAGWKCAE